METLQTFYQVDDHRQPTFAKGNGGEDHPPDHMKTLIISIVLLSSFVLCFNAYSYQYVCDEKLNFPETLSSVGPSIVSTIKAGSIYAVLTNAVYSSSIMKTDVVNSGISLDIIFPSSKNGTCLGKVVELLSNVDISDAAISGTISNSFYSSYIAYSSNTVSIDGNTYVEVYQYGLGQSHCSEYLGQLQGPIPVSGYCPAIATTEYQKCTGPTTQTHYCYVRPPTTAPVLVNVSVSDVLQLSKKLYNKSSLLDTPLSKSLYGPIFSASSISSNAAFSNYSGSVLYDYQKLDDIMLFNSGIYNALNKLGETKFPFNVLSSIIDWFDVLVSTPEAPKIPLKIGKYEYVIDLSRLDPLAVFMRWLLGSFFCICIAHSLKMRYMNLER